MLEAPETFTADSTRVILPAEATRYRGSMANGRGPKVTPKKGRPTPKAPQNRPRKPQVQRLDDSGQGAFPGLALLERLTRFMPFRHPRRLPQTKRAWWAAIRATVDTPKVRLNLTLALIVGLPILFGPEGAGGSLAAQVLLYNPTARAVCAVLGLYPIGFYGAVTGLGRSAAEQTANTSAIQACAAKANSAGGAEVVLSPSGTEFSGQLNFTLYENVTFRGGKGPCALGLFGGLPSLRYTGTGTAPAIIAPSARGLGFKNIYIEYTAATYTGSFWDFGYSASHPYDARDCFWEGCTFAGRGSGVNATTWFDQRKVINATYRSCTFARADRAIIGAQNGYANSHHYDRCWFGATKFYPVYQPGQGWKFTQPTIEGRIDGSAGFIEGDPATFAYGVTVDTPWAGDIITPGGNWIDGKFLGLLVTGGYWSSVLGTGALVKVRAGSMGVSVVGGTHNGPNIIDTSSGTVYAVGAHSLNAQGVSAVITHPDNVIKLVDLGNNGSDNRISHGLLVSGGTAPATLRNFTGYGVGFGRASALPSGFAAMVMQYDTAVGGMVAGSAGASPRMNGAAEFGIFGGQGEFPALKAARDYSTLPLGQRVKRTAVADTNYSLLVTDYLVAYTSLTAPRTVSIGTAVGKAGQVFVVKDESGMAGTHNITLDASAVETIDGALTKVINTDYGSVTFYSDGANWKVIA